MSSKSKFVPQAYLSITSVCTLQIRISHENGELYVYSIFCDETGRKLDRHIVKSSVQYSRKGAYFIRARVRYYLSEFMRVDPKVQD